MALLLSFLLLSISRPASISATDIHSNDIPPPPMPKHADYPQPTQFEVALLRTQEAVRLGTAPDPLFRKLDGSPGTLLDALLPDSPSEDEKAHLRRKLASRWRFLGANIPFLQGPTLAALNASFYRYASVRPNATVDWRRTMYITPIQAQYDCSSCWAMAAADSVAMVTAIAENRIGIMPGVQQLCDCSGLGCCNGGWPEDAFAWMVVSSNITTNGFYTYVAQDGQTCAVGSNYPVAGKISGWERVPMYSQDSLLKAVNMHPVLVYVSASSKDFQNYTSTAPGTPGFRIYDGGCLMEVNHALVVVGYDLTGLTPYWILKNSWISSGWGDNGYMYIAMLDGPGKCGMQTVNPMYPIYYPNSPIQTSVQQGTYPVMLFSAFWWTWWSWYGNPCLGIINPCGAGTCFRDTNNVARCLCPHPYVELVGVPTSKCLEPSPCTTALFRPCGAGTCMDVGDGSYICGCPEGYALGARTNGAPTCVPVAALNVRSRTFVVSTDRATCQSIAADYNMNQSRFAALNPYIQCNTVLPPGMVVALEPSSGVICRQQYAVRPGDTCGTIAYYIDQSTLFPWSWLNASYWSSSGNATLLYTVPYFNSSYLTTTLTSLTSLNPSLNCSTPLYSSQQLCVQGTNVNTTATHVVCAQTYTTVAQDTCTGVATKLNITVDALQRLNPGLNCRYNNGFFYAGVQLCYANATEPVDNRCTQWYTVQQGDTCAQIWNAGNLSQFQLLYINPGLQCQPPFLYVGRQVCVNSALLEDIPDPSYILYTVKPFDTWSSIQAQFTSRCQAWSITIDRIARQNDINDSMWNEYNLTERVEPLIIPCVYKLGAQCGCADSLPVCGANNVNYNSYCDARCNFATPTTDGACTSCQLACSGRQGLRPKPTTACATNYMCPWPTWPPPVSDASAVFIDPSILCKYRTATCVRVCAIYNSVNNLASTDATCQNRCMACHRVPCSGPSNTVPALTATCPYCFDNGTVSVGCLWSYNKFGAQYCSMDCDGYWNLLWNPLNP